MAKDDNKVDENRSFETDIDKASYLLGFNQTQQMLNQTAQLLSADAYSAGVKDALADAPNALAGVNFNVVIQGLQSAIEEKRRSEFAGVISAGDEFRAEYAKQPGVTELPSGLLYKVLESGDGGAKPGPTDQVTTHYHGTLIDGKVFDSSVQRNQPASFGVNGVIAGWTEALQLMSVGDKWELVIPPQLAYGERGAGADIAPHSTLIFEVELLSIDN